MRLILGVFISLFCFSQLRSQVVYSTDWKSEADLIVFKTKWKSEAKGNDGIWFFTEWKSEAKKKIYFTEWKSEADIVVYFSEWKSESGWQKNSKKHLFY